MAFRFRRLTAVIMAMTFAFASVPVQAADQRDTVSAKGFAMEAQAFALPIAGTVCGGVYFTGTHPEGFLAVWRHLVVLSPYLTLSALAMAASQKPKKTYDMYKRLRAFLEKNHDLATGTLHRLPGDLGIPEEVFPVLYRKVMASLSPEPDLTSDGTTKQKATLRVASTASVPPIEESYPLGFTSDLQNQGVDLTSFVEVLRQSPHRLEDDPGDVIPEVPLADKRYEREVAFMKWYRSIKSVNRDTYALASQRFRLPLDRILELILEVTAGRHERPRRRGKTAA